MFKIKKTTSSSKTIRMPDPLIEELEKLAYENEISFNQLVTQCCEYALSHIDKEDTDEKEAGASFNSENK